MDILFWSLGAVLAAVCWLLYAYTRLHRLCTARDQAFSDLSDALHQRQDLTLELVQLCSGYLVLENPLIEAVALSRSYAMQAKTSLAKAKTETDLCWALARLILVTADHQDLAGNPRLDELIESLGDSENKAAAAKTRYNRQIARLEEALSHTDTGMLATLFHIGAGTLFELDPKVAREAMMTMLAPAKNHMPGSKMVKALSSVAFTT